MLDTHHAAFPDRFYRSENLHKLADYGKLLDKDDKGKVKGFDKGAMKIVSGGKHPRSADDILVSAAGRPRATRSSSCSTTRSSPRPRTSTSA